MDRLVAYISHPLGEDGIGGSMRDNLANVGDWIRWIIARTRYVVLCPWYVYAVTLHRLDSSAAPPDPFDPKGKIVSAPRQLIDSIVAIERSDVVIQCGGIINPHMQYEARAARRVGTPIADVTSFGILPPGGDPFRDDEDAAILVINRIEKAITRAPRRVWMPLLTADDIMALKSARHGLYAHLPGEHDAAVALLDRILTAAHESGSEETGS